VGFDREKLETALNTRRQYTYLHFSCHLFESVPSTNQTAWELLSKGEKTGCVVIATEQSAGRGQWGRQWISPVGGLYISVAIAPQIEAQQSYQLTLASAWGIASRLQNSGVPVEIKWPNDLVLDGRKLGGILTETKVQRGKIAQAVIGVGINWSNPVPETGISLKTWQETQPNSTSVCSLEMLASAVLLGIESGIQSLFQEGITILLSRYQSILGNMGDKVYVNNILGTVIGVTDTGYLRVFMEKSDAKSVRTPEIYIQPGTISLGYRKFSERSHD
jgi:BirA family transcriptional regulator, biotin operon repressor / biotin---[acetyl-CoA-carboxylase] ligase